MVAVSVFLFGYTVLIGWAFYGEQFFEYLFGPRVDRAVSLGLLPADSARCVSQVDAVWDWGDIFNGLQVFPNVIGLIGLSGIAAAYASENPGDKSRRSSRKWEVFSRTRARESVLSLVAPTVRLQLACIVGAV